MKYNKLIRDKIPTIIKKGGRVPVVHTADNLEYWKKLKEKLTEEIEEFYQSETVEELADVFEVIDAIIKYKKIDRRELVAIKNKKLKERGGFSKKIILEES